MPEAPPPSAVSSASATAVPTGSVPEAKQAQQPSAAPQGVPLRVWVRTELGESDATVAPLVREQVRERLRVQGFREVARAERELTVIVRWSGGADAASFETYAIDYSLTTTRDRVGSLVLTTRCERCGLGELMRRLDEDIEVLRPELTAPVQVEPPPPHPTEAFTAIPAEVSSLRRPPLSAMGKAGVGVLVVGVASLAAGIGFLATPDRERVLPMNPSRVEVRTFRAPGIATASIGASAVVVGIVLMAVDRSRAARKRGTTASQGRHRTALAAATASYRDQPISR